MSIDYARMQETISMVQVAIEEISDQAKAAIGERPSLRDYFAGQALAGLLSNDRLESDWIPIDVARDAYTMADAMLAERSNSDD